MIIKSYKEVYLNAWGHEEQCDVKTIEKSLSAHMNGGSPFSTDDSCDNCDGGNCHRCHEVYTVTIFEKPVYDEEMGCEVVRTKLWKRFLSLEDATEFYNQN